MNTSTLRILRDNIVAFLDECGMSQRDLAEKAGIAPKTVNNIVQAEERGISPIIENVEAIANAIGVSLAQLLSPNLQIDSVQAVKVGRDLPRDLGRLVEDFLLCSESQQKEILTIVSKYVADRP